MRQNHWSEKAESQGKFEQISNYCVLWLMHSQVGNTWNTWNKNSDICTDP